MTRILVLLSNMSPMLRTVIKGLVMDSVDLQIEEHLGPPESLWQAVASTQPDVVIIGTGFDQVDLRGVELLYASPRSRVLELATDGGDTTMYQLLPHVEAVSDVSREGLLTAIRRPLTADSPVAQS